MTVNIHEAKTNLSKYVNLVLQGEEVIIARRNKPEVKLTLLNKPKKARFPFKSFRELPAFGMWKHRKDITDSVEYIRKLRKESWDSRKRS